MAPVGFIMGATGLVLIWSGIRGENAVQLVLDVLAGNRKVKAATKPSAGAGPGGTPAPASPFAGAGTTGTGKAK